MHQVFEVSSALELLTLRAAIDAGVITPATRRTAVLADVRPIPEVGPSFFEAPVARALLTAFDRIVPLSDALAPLHARAWEPPDWDLAAWRGRVLGADADDPDELFLASHDTPPSAALSRVFPDTARHVHRAALEAYGPSPSPPGLGGGALVYPDLVPGAPLMSYAAGTRALPVPIEALRDALASALTAGNPTLESRVPAGEGPLALIVGQAFHDAGVLTADDDARVHIAMLDRAIDKGAMRAVVAPHPAATTSLLATLDAHAQRRGMALTFFHDGPSAEFLAAQLPVALVVGCSSTALVAIAHLLDVPVEAVGTDIVLEEARPFEHASRIPAVITAHQFAREVQLPASAPPLASLLGAVGYAMYPRANPERRDAAIETISAVLGTPAMGFFKRRRLTSLGLPGGLPEERPGLVGRARRRAGRALGALRRRRGPES